MKRIIYLSILAIIMPLMTNCNSGKCTLEVNTKFCTVEGLKDTYNTGERVELTLNPYPYFELPAEKFISIYGVSNVDYDYANKKIAFNINQNASLSFPVISSFGGKEVDRNILELWSEKTNKKVIKLEYKYCFETVWDIASEQYEIVMDLINRPFVSRLLTQFVGEIVVSVPNQLNKTLSPITVFKDAENSTYITNSINPSRQSYHDEMLIYSSNATVMENITGVSGCAHWKVPYGENENYCDYAYLSFNNAIIGTEVEGKMHYSDPINGYVEMHMVCGKEIES